MKARVKATGKIVDVDYIEGDYLHTSDGLYLIAELEGIESDIDYWTRLEHTYAGMAMQGILTNPIGFENIRSRGRNIQVETALLASEFAHALVEKMKQEREG